MSPTDPPLFCRVLLLHTYTTHTLTSAIFPLSKMYSVPSSTQISCAARDAIKSLKDIGVESCFVGGMACQLYGNSRKPNVSLAIPPPAASATPATLSSATTGPRHLRPILPLVAGATQTAPCRSQSSLLPRRCTESGSHIQSFVVPCVRDPALIFLHEIVALSHTIVHLAHRGQNKSRYPPPRDYGYPPLP